MYIHTAIACTYCHCKVHLSNSMQLAAEVALSRMELMQFERWLSAAKLHGAWCGIRRINCMHFDNQLAVVVSCG